MTMWRKVFGPGEDDCPECLIMEMDAFGIVPW